MMDDDKVKRWIQGALLAWFVVASLFVFVPAAVLLYRASPVTTAEVPIPVAPVIPPPPNLDSTLKTEQVSAYNKYVDAQLSRYDKELNVYKERLGVGGTRESRNDLISVYKVVVSDVLDDFLEKVLATLLAFAFVEVGFQLVAAWRAKRNAGA